MKAVILAAGMATRLRPLTDHTPKCLLKIGDRSLLERAIDNLLVNGIKELVIVTGYLQEQIVSLVDKRYPELKVEYIFNKDYATTNNIYSLWLVKNAVAHSDVLLLDSDILFDSELIKALLNSSFTNCLALNNHPLGEEEIKVIPDDNGFVKEISKTCSIPDAIGESIGIEKMDASYMEVLFTELDQMILQEKLVGVFYEMAFERLIAKGKTFGIVDTSSFFSMELDTVEDFEQATSKIPPHLL
ncbi:phosphocholine cytidylyltransferase family protein [Porphyromonadaceae bacterium OttesenSCG-928-L07]|nr:phosphocholine cytidylyltransferase family protein [Porphyromonadaceae bacterium OttesenSCG-928-L07]MDL2251269.1 phosphocholine cytidylyltransferase family protein [Odoribacter sp. OttesenSCG-928-J03]